MLETINLTYNSARNKMQTAQNDYIQILYIYIYIYILEFE